MSNNIDWLASFKTNNAAFSRPNFLILKHVFSAWKFRNLQTEFYLDG